MNQAHHPPKRVHQVHRTTVGDVDPQANIRAIRDDAIRARTRQPGNFAVSYEYGHPVTMHLLGGDEKPVFDAGLPASFPVANVQPRERVGAVRVHVQTSHPLHKTVPERQSGE